MSEWFKESVLKTDGAATHRGFESHPLRIVNNEVGAFVRALRAMMNPFIAINSYSRVQSCSADR